MMVVGLGRNLRAVGTVCTVTCVFNSAIRSIMERKAHIAFLLSSGFNRSFANVSLLLICTVQTFSCVTVAVPTSSRRATRWAYTCLAVSCVVEAFLLMNVDFEAVKTKLILSGACALRMVECFSSLDMRIARGGMGGGGLERWCDSVVGFLRNRVTRYNGASLSTLLIMFLVLRGLWSYGLMASTPLRRHLIVQAWTWTLGRVALVATLGAADLTPVGRKKTL